MGFALLKQGGGVSRPDMEDIKMTTIIKRTYIKQNPANTLPSDHSESQYQKAVEAFNNELNDYYEKNVADERPYFGNGAMSEYLSDLEDALTDGTDLTWELGKKTQRGCVASFSPSEEWEQAYLEIEEFDIDE